MSKKLYTAYGLVFQSDWEIPELLEGSGQPDITLRTGEVPKQLEEFSGDKIASFCEKTRQVVHAHFMLQSLVHGRKTGEVLPVEETNLRMIC